ncbi:MAG: type II toxin-antitoxin system HicA family toxin [Ktedonobacteraceae bacterium]
MPPKIRQLKTALKQTGFTERKAKGSHTAWKHPNVPGIGVTLAGHDGDDAQEYQIKQVERAIRQVRGKI